MIMQAEYIWIDGAEPTTKLRGKTRFLSGDTKLLPDWSFDGSSTNQAVGKDSDLHLHPVLTLPDPFKGGSNCLVLCEVLLPSGEPHASNTRAKLRGTLNQLALDQEPWIGFEQEYTLFRDGAPMGWPKGGFPAPQGPFYCGVGAQEVFGRPISEEHAAACLRSGLMLFGTNAEVMPGQWEFQIGYRGFPHETADPLTVSDHLWLARWILLRVCEVYESYPSLDPKPIVGDWNGAGAHTNFSTRSMRNPITGLDAISQAVKLLHEAHEEHIEVYGDRLHARLTGMHETSRLDQFFSGIADRTASVRIPRHVNEQGFGYIEDRRPGANIDPYVVSERLLRTICLTQ